jgi:hypothetical protein
MFRLHLLDEFNRGEGHRALWKRGLHHRDISDNNLMYYKDEQGEVMGVLNDFDLLILQDDSRQLATERTGTMPFMAAQLLRQVGSGNAVVHTYGQYVR